MQEAVCIESLLLRLDTKAVCRGTANYLSSNPNIQYQSWPAPIAQWMVL